jgi:hypothetical protein
MTWEWGLRSVQSGILRSVPKDHLYGGKCMTPDQNPPDPDENVIARPKRFDGEPQDSPNKKIPIMRIVFSVVCVVGFMVNCVVAMVFGLGHSTHDYDKSSCILTPFFWIGRNLGNWRHDSEFGFYGTTLAIWGVVFYSGWILSSRERSPFWALILIPLFTGISLSLTFLLGWPFGKLP